jgi:hypothetical protein
MLNKFYPLVLSTEIDASGEPCPPVPYGKGHDTAEAAHQEGLELDAELHTYTHRISEVWE